MTATRADRHHAYVATPAATCGGCYHAGRCVLCLRAEAHAIHHNTKYPGRDPRAGAK